jgi:hypothetical protein
LVVEPGTGGGGERRYSLPHGHAEVLTDGDRINFFAPMGRALVGIGAVMTTVVDAFRAGGGVPYEAYGADIRSAISALNPPGFMSLLGTQWFPAITDVDSRLRAKPPARVADIGCGTGWSSIGIAKAYPLVTVDGLDLDSASIEDAKRNAETSGVSGRVKFEVRDAADPTLAGSYDLVTAFETIHYISNPVGALRAMRAASSKMAGRSSLPTRRSRKSSKLETMRSSGSCTASARCTAFRSAWSSPIPPAPER